MRYEFPSILNDNRTYAYDSNDWYQNAPIDSYLSYVDREDGRFCTPRMVPVEQAGELFASIAVAMAENEDMMNHMAYKFQSAPSEPELNFVMSIKYNPKRKKQQY